MNTHEVNLNCTPANWIQQHYSNRRGMWATAERNSSPDARLIQPRKWANVTPGVARVKPHVMTELMQRKSLKTQHKDVLTWFPKNGSKERGRDSPAFSLLLNTTQHHKFYQSNSVRKRGTQIQKNAFLKTAHADGQLLQSENHKERIPPLTKSQSYCMNAVISTGPNSSTVTSAQACWQHLTRSQYSPWEGD